MGVLNISFCTVFKLGSHSIRGRCYFELLLVDNVIYGSLASVKNFFNQAIYRNTFKSCSLSSMMGFKKLFRSTEMWILIIFLVVLTIRLFIAFQSEFFNYDTYYTLRQVESVKSTGLPLYNDPLSYGGKQQILAPFYYYFLAFFSLFMPLTLAAKIIPNIFASFIVILTYIIALRITKSQRTALLTGFMSGFIPIIFNNINKAGNDYLSIILVFGIIYCMFRINERKYIDYTLILIFILVLTSPLALILILGLLFYLLLLKLEDQQVEMKELEIILFFAFLAFWVNLLLYKNAFLSHGLMVIWQNIPSSIISDFFSQLTLLEAILTISLIPLLLGLYAFYINFHLEKNKEVMLLTGFAISTFLLMWFRLLDFITSLMFMSIALVIIASYSIKKISNTVEKTKFHKQSKILIVILIIIFAATSIYPALIIGMDKSSQVPSEYDLIVLEWAYENTPQNSVIASTVDEGNIVTHIAKRKNIMDNNYLLTQNIDQRLKDVDTLYQTKFQIDAVSILNKYKSKYILLTDYARKKYNIDDLSYSGNEECFQRIFYSNNSTLYLAKCKIR